MSDFRNNQKNLVNSTSEIHLDRFSSDNHERDNNLLNSLLSEKKKEYFNESLELISDIHNILLNCEDLSNQDKLELCSRARSYMKSYLREILIRVQLI
ncbi:MAG: hypothetical protein ACFFAN_10665 [Promethearchaeota archaeon]